MYRRASPLPGGFFSGNEKKSVLLRHAGIVEMGALFVRMEEIHETVAGATRYSQCDE